MPKQTAPKNTKVSVSRSGGSVNKIGSKMSGNVGSKVTDGAGSRSRAALPPETVAIRAPKAELPAEAKKMASSTMPVPGVNDAPIKTYMSWDMSRDRGLKESS